MNPKRRAFVNAYLGPAQGNGTKAAIAAGYSEAAAAQVASRLLRVAEIAEAIEGRLDKADISTNRILERLGRIVHAEPEKVTGADIVGASRVILQVNGALKDKQSESRITVNIGFLQQNHVGDEPTIRISSLTDANDEQTLVLPREGRVALLPGS